MDFEAENAEILICLHSLFVWLVVRGGAVLTASSAAEEFFLGNSLPPLPRTWVPVARGQKKGLNILPSGKLALLLR